MDQRAVHPKNLICYEIMPELTRCLPTSPIHCDLQEEPGGTASSPEADLRFRHQATFLGQSPQSFELGSVGRSAQKQDRQSCSARRPALKYEFDVLDSRYELANA